MQGHIPFLLPPTPFRPRRLQSAARAAPSAACPVTPAASDRARAGLTVLLGIVLALTTFGGATFNLVITLSQLVIIVLILVRGLRHHCSTHSVKRGADKIWSNPREGVEMTHTPQPASACACLPP